MLQVVAEKKALKTLGNYFAMLSKTGYVKNLQVRRFLAYLFLIDFVEYTSAYFTRKDYDTVAEALGRLFANGGCLMPYPIFCSNRIKVGKPYYMGALRLRVTEGKKVEDRIKRITEDEILRRF